MSTLHDDCTDYTRAIIVLDTKTLLDPPVDHHWIVRPVLERNNPGKDHAAGMGGSPVNYMQVHTQKIAKHNS